MIIWQGFGILALLIPIAISLAAKASLDALYGTGFTDSHMMVLAVSLLLSSLAVWFVGARLNGGRGKMLVDPESGERVELKKRHTLFWIPMQWISIGIAAAGIWVAIA